MSRPSTSTDTTRGNSRPYRITRLKRDAPDIAQRVIANEISAAAGIRELDERQGKRKAKATIPDVHDPEQVIKVLLYHCDRDMLLEILEGLEDALAAQVEK